MTQASNDSIKTALGLLGGVLAAFFGCDYFSEETVATLAVGFGTGIAGSNSVLRTAHLFKDGTPNTNEFGTGIRAGLAIFAALAGMKVMPRIYKMFKDRPLQDVEKFRQNTLLLLGGGVCLGVLHNGDILMKFIK